MLRRLWVIRRVNSAQQPGTGPPLVSTSGIANGLLSPIPPWRTCEQDTFTKDSSQDHRCYGSVRPGIGHTLQHNIIFGLQGRVENAGWDTPALLTKSQIAPDAMSPSDSVLHTISADENCYVSPFADFQAVSRRVPTPNGTVLEHYTLDEARTVFGLDLNTKFVLSSDPSLIFHNPGAFDYAVAAGSPCESYGADMSQIPPAL